jgi:hypothetical protein
MTRSVRDATSLHVVALVAAVVVQFRRGGTSPLISPDTFIDDPMLRSCLTESMCNFGGIESSVPGFFNPSGWLHARAALETVGFGIDAMHRMIVFGNAFAVIPTVLVASRLGGPLAGILAATFFVGWILPLSEHAEWLVSRAPLPLLGAVFLAVAVRAVERRSFAATMLAACLGGVMTSFYASAAPAIVAVVVVALMAPRRRRLEVVLASVAVFTFLAWVTTPAGWLFDVRQLFTRTGRFRSVTFGAWGIDGFFVFAASAVLVAVWARTSLPTLRKAMEIPLAVMVPPVAVLLGGGLVGLVPFSSRYIIQAGPAAAVAAALPCAAALSFRAGQRSDPRRYLMRTLAGWSAACTVVAIGLTASRDTSLDALTVADARAVAGILRDRGWTQAKALRSLQTPDRSALRAIDEWLPAGSDLNDATDAILLNVPRSKLPSPLPASWMIANAIGRRVTVIALTTSWLDWRSVQMCVTKSPDGGEQCASTSRIDWIGRAPIRIDPPASVRVRVPIVVPPGASSTQRVATHTLPLGCHGHILSVTQPEGGHSVVDEDGKSATLAAGDDLSPSEVIFEWEIGSEECRHPQSFAQFPPFVLEGDADTVTSIENMLGRLSE